MTMHGNTPFVILNDGGVATNRTATQVDIEKFRPFAALLLVRWAMLRERNSFDMCFGNLSIDSFQRHQNGMSVRIQSVIVHSFSLSRLFFRTILYNQQVRSFSCQQNLLDVLVKLPTYTKRTETLRVFFVTMCVKRVRSLSLSPFSLCASKGVCCC